MSSSQSDRFLGATRLPNRDKFGRSDLHEPAGHETETNPSGVTDFAFGDFIGFPFGLSPRINFYAVPLGLFPVADEDWAYQYKFIGYVNLGKWTIHKNEGGR